jgi:hypothetical protein
MATITWSIISITILPQVDGYSNFAWQVICQCSATDGTNTQSTKFGLTFPPEKQGQPYIPYDQLTEAQVVDWSKQELGSGLVADTEASLVNMLTATPAPLPWSV